MPGRWRGREGRVEIEFRASAALLSALLADPWFSIELPRWLRDRLVVHLHSLLTDNQAPAT